MRLNTIKAKNLYSKSTESISALITVWVLLLLILFILRSLSLLQKFKSVVARTLKKANISQLWQTDGSWKNIFQQGRAVTHGLLTASCSFPGSAEWDRTGRGLGQLQSHLTIFYNYENYTWTSWTGDFDIRFFSSDGSGNLLFKIIKQCHNHCLKHSYVIGELTSSVECSYGSSRFWCCCWVLSCSRVSLMRRATSLWVPGFSRPIRKLFFFNFL